jgi:hypothetical protein
MLSTNLNNNQKKLNDFIEINSSEKTNKNKTNFSSISEDKSLFIK